MWESSTELIVVSVIVEVPPARATAADPDLATFVPVTVMQSSWSVTPLETVTGPVISVSDTVPESAPPADMFGSAEHDTAVSGMQPMRPASWLSQYGPTPPWPLAHALSPLTQV
jgi:hypothetical protein